MAAECMLCRAERITPLTTEAPPWRVAVKRRAVGTIHAALPPASAMSSLKAMTV